MPSRKRKLSYAQRAQEGLSPANNLKIATQPALVVEMNIQEENFIPVQQVHLSHGLGYSSKPQNTGDGVFPLLGYRSIPGSRTAMEEKL